ncbi:MAG: Fe-S cluster assembly protein SufD [Gammaproteobacteria bacterium]|nr:Fe-S cluster assembly protein SufD [Gammaproteobacteria bacterium]
MTEPAAQAFLEEFERDPGRLDWLAPERRAAIEIYRKLGLPNPRQESWKYTDVRLLTRRRFRAASLAPAAAASAAASGHGYGSEDCHEIVFVNGRLSAGNEALPAPSGARIRSLAEAAGTEPARVTEQLGRHAADDGRAFVALNTALMSDGAVIDIAPGTDSQKPLHLLHHCAPGNAPAAVYTRNLVTVGANARATLIETYTGVAGSEYFMNTVTEIELGPGAALEYYRVQQESLAAFHVGSLAVRQERASRFHSFSIDLGGLLVRNDVDVRLAAGGADARLDGLYIAVDRQHVDNHTRIDHEQPQTRSVENYRGILDGRARAVFNGKVVVHKNAQKTDAQQSNANLLLSSNAEVDTKPELEIYADDVKCGHGATVGRLDEDMLFYLRTRAIPEATARNLLTFAFADEIIRPMPCRMVRDRLEHSVARTLPGAAVIGEFMQ